VTIATNMAGRGTDILLGGNPEYMALAKSGGDKNHPDYPRLLAEFEAQCAREREQVIAAGGLHILGTERHESRRIDNQLRGRAGRQGDPGSSQFYLSLEDDLMRIFGGDKIKPWMERLGLQDGEAIEHGMVSRSIQNAQKKVEARNFDMRKHLLDYDNVMNQQRQGFYGKRREVLAAATCTRRCSRSSRACWSRTSARPGPSAATRPRRRSPASPSRSSASSAWPSTRPSRRSGPPRIARRSGARCWRS